MEKYKNLISPLKLILLISYFFCQRSYAQEFMIYDSILTITERDKGFIYFSPDTTNGSNWLEPYDYYNGKFETRYEILEYGSDLSMQLSICIWSEVKGQWEEFKENCCPRKLITGKGIFTSTSSPQSWWKRKDIPVDFTQVNLFHRMGLVVWCEKGKNMSPWVPPEESCWEERIEYLPMKLRLLVVAVAADHEFSGWNNYPELKKQ